jgi:hypothetical protein
VDAVGQDPIEDSSTQGIEKPQNFEMKDVSHRHRVSLDIPPANSNAQRMGKTAVTTRESPESSGGEPKYVEPKEASQAEFIQRAG